MAYCKKTIKQKKKKLKTCCNGLQNGLETYFGLNGGG